MTSYFGRPVPNSSKRGEAEEATENVLYGNTVWMYTGGVLYTLTPHAWATTAIITTWIIHSLAQFQERPTWSGLRGVLDSILKTEREQGKTETLLQVSSSPSIIGWQQMGDKKDTTGSMMGTLSWHEFYRRIWKSREPLRYLWRPTLGRYTHTYVCIYIIVCGMKYTWCKMVWAMNQRHGDRWRR